MIKVNNKDTRMTPTYSKSNQLKNTIVTWAQILNHLPTRVLTIWHTIACNQ